MRSVLVGISGALAVVLIPLLARGAEPSKPQRPGPQMMFDRMDKNHDGKLTADEIPAGTPERLKEMLRRADKNDDKVVTREEFQASLREMSPRMGGFGGDRRGPRGPGEAGRGRPRPQVPARPFGGPGGRRPEPGLTAGGPPRLPDLKQLFEKWDTNHDKSLSYDEFAAGVKQFHRGLAGMGFPRLGGPGPWFFGPRGPWLHRRWMGVYGGGPWGRGPWHRFGWMGGYGPWHHHGWMGAMGGPGAWPGREGMFRRWPAMRPWGEKPAAERRPQAEKRPSEKKAAPEKGKPEQKPEARKPEEKKPA